MSRSNTKRIPWLDRWTEPTLEQLLQPIEDQRRKVIDSLIEQVEAFDEVETSIIWYGQSWRWTIQFTVPDARGEEQVLAYLVPSPQSPIFCVPLRDAVITRLPLRRLNKYIRDALRSAKCAVEVHWAMWNPSNNVEVEQLVDLIKRKHKLLRTPAEPPASE
jgi:hypothetical protein